MRLLALVLLPFLIGCTEALAPLAGVDVPEPGDALVLVVGPGIDTGEVEAAASAWREASGGLIDVRVVSGGEGDANLELGDESLVSRRRRLMVLSRKDLKFTRAVVANMVGAILNMPTHHEQGIMNETNITLPISAADVENCREVGWCR
jgi:hypothetical protein